MIFCKKCGSMVIPKKVDGKNVVICSCGYSEKTKQEVKFTSKIEEKDLNFEVQESGDERLPVCEAKCDKCDNKEAYYWEIQTRASDEPPTRFFRCTKCKQTWRDYS